MDWSYLDNLDYNLLYTYARGFMTSGSRFCMEKFCISPKEEVTEESEIKNIEVKRQTALYIIWCVFRHILNCKTLQEAEVLATEENIRKYKITNLLRKRYIFIGVYGINEIYLYKYEEGDINVILEILYNRYDLMEQMECFARRTEGQQRKTRKRCIRMMKQYREMLTDNERYKILKGKEGL